VRLKTFINFVLDHFEKKKPSLLSDLEEPSEHSVPTNLAEHVENALKVEALKKSSSSTMAALSNSSATKKLNLASNSSVDNDSYFIDSITGRHIALVKKSLLSLMRLAQLHALDQAASNSQPTSSTFETNFLNQNLDLISYMKLVSRIENITNVFNYLEVLPFLKIDNSQKWDMNKPTRLNQDNQRETDLKRFREISSYLIKVKLLDEHLRKQEQRTPIANLLISSLSSSSVNSASNSGTNNGGYYCRIEMEWKQRISF
jgi:hypothetical protein